MNAQITSIYNLSDKISREFDFLSDFHYNIMEINLRNLDGFKESGTERPYCNLIFGNGKNRKLSINYYDNRIVFLWIRNFPERKEFIFDDYFMWKNKMSIRMEFSKGESHNGYVDFYINSARQSLNSDLKSIILGEQWIDIPVNWQGQK
jgi:hypothetical protein